MGLTNDGIENEQNPFNPLPPAEFLYNGKDSSGKVLLIPLPLISSTLYLNLNLSIINTHPQHLSCLLFPNCAIAYEEASLEQNSTMVGSFF